MAQKTSARKKTPAHAPKKRNVSRRNSIGTALQAWTYLRSIQKSAFYKEDEKYLEAKFGRDRLEEAAKDFKVNEGQVTFDSEISKDLKLTSLHLHWPGGESGITIGPGYDLKKRNDQEVRGHMDKVSKRLQEKGKEGLSPSQIEILVSAVGIGLPGHEAKKFIAENQKSFGEITPLQQKTLFEVVYPDYVQRQKNSFQNKEAEFSEEEEGYKEIAFETLDPHVKDVLVDLTYVGLYKQNAPKLHEAARNNDVEGLIQILSDKKKWGKWEKTHRSRLDKLANHLKNSAAYQKKK